MKPGRDAVAGPKRARPADGAQQQHRTIGEARKREGRGEGKQGQEVGTITTDPGEIDGIVRRAWNKIYRGTKLDSHKAAVKIITKYANDI